MLGGGRPAFRDQTGRGLVLSATPSQADSRHQIGKDLVGWSAQHVLQAPRYGARFGVDVDDGRVALQGETRQHRRRAHCRRGPGDEEHIAALGQLLSALPGLTGSGSPNNTTSGRRSSPQQGQCGGLS